MKKSSLALLGGIASVFCLFAFTVPTESAEKMLSVIFPERQPALLPLNVAQDTLPPLEDRDGSFLTPGNNNPIDLKDPEAVTQSVEYDPVTGQYIIEEKIGDEYFRTPTYMTFDEYVRLREQQQQREYFDKLNGVVSGGGTSDGLNIGDPVKKFDIKTSLVDRLFGGTQVNIEPQGNVNLTFGVNHQQIQNPNIPVSQQRFTLFDFDMDINMSANGQIGEKLKLDFNYNTQATFDFDNQMKLNYDTKNFSEDEIIQGVQAGNVSMPLKSNLIQGAQRLFGLKTDFKFGHLRLTTLAAQQQSRQQNLQVQGGSQIQNYDVAIDNYDENRHFFLTHYNRNTFEPSLKCLPIVTNLFTITRMEVWITNDINRTENTRDVVALADLGEPIPFKQQFDTPQLEKDIYGAGLPWNGANDLFPRLARALGQDSTVRYSNKIIARLQSSEFGMNQILDFEKARARLLSTSEYTYHEQLGFVSLNLNVQPDQTVGVALEYLYNGKPYRIGEFSNDVIMGDTLNQNVLFLKMLKSTNANVNLPIWDLMMKNVYSLGAANVDPKDFKFDIFYDDPGKGQKRFLDGTDISTNINSRPLLQLFRMDTLNVQGDPGPDGVFDFVPGLTYNQRTGRVMFPVLEPFGRHLNNLMITGGMDSILRQKYVYQQLYDSTLFRAREFQQLNRFSLRGTYKGTNSSRISLGSFNVPRGSVRVTAGGRQLTEGQDFEVDYNLGQVTILNDAYTQSGQQVNVSFEDNALFSIQNRTMLGVRADYEFSKDLTIGGTFMNLFERPLTQKVNFGDDPINNKVFGADINLTKKAPILTKLVDKLPFYSTKAESSFNFQGEIAALRPGHSRAINNGPDQGGVVFVDDFEGSTAAIPLGAGQFNQWIISSVPQNHPDGLFPESALLDTILNGVNRSRISWYTADPLVSRGTTSGSDPYTRLLQFDEIFPNRQLSPLEQTNLRPFDITIYPRERGPYNFDVPSGTNYSSGLEVSGQLRDPETRWAGLMRGINQNDFEATNVEFIEFWMLNPYMDKTNGSSVSQEGSMYIDLGSLSEDIMRDSRQFFENAIPTNTQSGIATTAWGRVPAIAPIINGFENNEASRVKQDVGLDGLDSIAEVMHFAPYLAQIASSPLSLNAKAEILADPSADNFKHYLSPNFPDATGVLERYKYFNGLENNSPVNTGQAISESAKQLPDAEDLNDDKTLNESEAYFQYKVDFKRTTGPDGKPVLDLTSNELKLLVTDTVMYNRDGNTYVWYRFRIPLDNENRRAVGGIQDFRSIRFIRTYFTNWTEQTTFRFATFELGRNQWRRFRQNTDLCGDGNAALLELNSVNIEENAARTPFNYVLPNGVRREQSVGAFPDILQNEQSLSMRVCELPNCGSRAVFKPLNLDMRLYEYLKMYVHAEGLQGQVIEPGELSLFLRIGSDYVNNYYELEVPLTMSNPQIAFPPNSTEYRDEVWLPSNNIELKLESLINLKQIRNEKGVSFAIPYEEPDPLFPKNKLRIVGNPNLGLVKGVMVGVRSNLDESTTPKSLCFETWINELRLTGFNERAGWASLARMDMKLADLGNVSLAGNYTSIGWGSLEQKIQQRSREEVIQMDVSSNIELGKFFPEKSGVRLPLYVQYSNVTKNPEFDPYDLDVRLKDKLRDVTDREVRDSIRSQAKDITITRGYNLTNVRKDRVGKPRKVPLPWNIENFSVSYARNQQIRRNPLILNDELNQQRGALDYKYNPKGKSIQPLKKVIKKDKYLKFLTDFNFNPIPSGFGFNSTMERYNNVTTYRFAGEDPLLNTYYNRRLTWDRNYNFNWDLAKSLKFTFDATARSIVDEPLGYNPDGTPISNKEWRDSVWTNIKDLGRPKNYNHTLALNYTLPFKSIPFMDWVNVRASYTGGYAWNATSLKLQDLEGSGNRESPISNLGNTAQNNSTRQINGDFNFEQLYNKSKYLAKINKPVTKGKKKGEKGSKSDPNKSSDGPGGRGEDKGGRGSDLGPGGKGDDSGPGGISGGGKGKDRAPAIDPRNPDKSTPPAPSRGDNKAGDQSQPGGLSPVGVAGAEPGKSGATPGGKDGEPGAAGDAKSAAGAKKSSKDKKDAKGKKREPSMAERIALRPLMLVRKGRLNYTETYATVLPGFVPEAKILGLAEGLSAPGLPFIAGFKPSDAWVRSAADNDLISQRPELNQQFTRNFSQNVDAALTIEPFTDFRVELTGNRQFSRNSSELFKDQNFALNPDSINFETRGQRDMGQLTVSYFTLNTLFDRDLYGLFDRFANNRTVISSRLGILAGNTSPHVEDGPGYTFGYGKVQNEVLMPAFLAAYTKTDPNAQGLDVFKTLPKPNWKLTYNGLHKVGDLSNVFSSIQITHGYRNTMTMNSYQTDIFYDQNNPSQIDTLNFNYVARYEIPQLTITEAMQPLLGIDVKTKGGLTARLDMKKSRTLALSFVDYNLVESNSEAYTFGFGYKLKKVNIPFLTGQKKKKGKKKTGSEENKIENILGGASRKGRNSGSGDAQDLTFKFDFEYRDDITVNHRLELSAPDADPVATRGTRTISIVPSIDYNISSRLKLRLFTDYRRTVPKVTTAFPITQINTGVTVQFSL